MILVDVFVPSVDKTYNFSLAEDVPISAVLEELIEMVETFEQAPFAGERQNIQLIDARRRFMLPKDNTLKECEIPTGSTLIML